ncbi:MAG: hypothetical protein ACRYG8_43130 [Janthinobacterium lividum]
MKQAITRPAAAGYDGSEVTITAAGKPSRHSREAVHRTQAGHIPGPVGSPEKEHTPGAERSSEERRSQAGHSPEEDHTRAERSLAEERSQSDHTPEAHTPAAGIQAHNRVRRPAAAAWSLRLRRYLLRHLR